MALPSHFPIIFLNDENNEVIFWDETSVIYLPQFLFIYQIGNRWHSFSNQKNSLELNHTCKCILRALEGENSKKFLKLMSFFLFFCSCTQKFPCGGNSKIVQYDDVLFLSRPKFWWKMKFFHFFFYLERNFPFSPLDQLLIV